MKDFTRPRGRLRSLPLAARVVYSVFLLFTLVALALSAWLAADMVGGERAGVATYYAGQAAPPGPAAQPAPSGGPELELPAEADASPAEPPMSLRKLLEVTHFHLFSMPVYLLILSHLFMLSRLSERSKVFWIVGATLAVAGHIGAPWFARTGAAGSTWAYALSGAALAITMLVLSFVPLLEMWSAARSE